MYWFVLSFLSTLSQLLFYCSATAIITEHSYFLWKQKPSASVVPFRLAIQKFNLSVDLKKIKTAIQEASVLNTKDQKPALAKIALENCICESLNPKSFNVFLSLIQFSFIKFQTFFWNFRNVMHVSTYHHHDIFAHGSEKKDCII